MAFFISGGNVSNHCTAADRSFAKLRKGERICFKSSGARSGTDLFHSRKIVLPMPGCSPGGPASCDDVVRAVGYPPHRPIWRWSRQGFLTGPPPFKSKRL